MQKQQANTRMIATKAMETMAQDGTAKEDRLLEHTEQGPRSQARAALKPRFQKVIRTPDSWDKGWKIGNWHGGVTPQPAPSEAGTIGRDGRDRTQQLRPI